MLATRVGMPRSVCVLCVCDGQDVLEGEDMLGEWSEVRKPPPVVGLSWVIVWPNA